MKVLLFAVLSFVFGVGCILTGLLPLFTNGRVSEDEAAPFAVGLGVLTLVFIVQMAIAVFRATKKKQAPYPTPGGPPGHFRHGPQGYPPPGYPPHGQHPQPGYSPPPAYAQHSPQGQQPQGYAPAPPQGYAPAPQGHPQHGHHGQQPQPEPQAYTAQAKLPGDEDA